MLEGQLDGLNNCKIAKENVFALQFSFVFHSHLLPCRTTLCLLFINGRLTYYYLGLICNSAFCKIYKCLKGAHFLSPCTMVLDQGGGPLLFTKLVKIMIRQKNVFSLYYDFFSTLHKNPRFNSALKRKVLFRPNGSNSEQACSASDFEFHNKKTSVGRRG